MTSNPTKREKVNKKRQSVDIGANISTKKKEPNELMNLFKILDGLKKAEKDEFTKWAEEQTPQIRHYAMMQRDVREIMDTLSSFEMKWGIPLRLKFIRPKPPTRTPK